MRMVFGDIQLATQIPFTRGRTLFVNNHTTAGYGGALGNDVNDASIERPMATIKAAVAAAVAGRGDIIIPMWGHAETIDDATDLALNKAGLLVYGQPIFDHSGRQIAPRSFMPSITFGTNTTANIPISAAGVGLMNMRLVCAKDALAQAVTVTAANVAIAGCEFDAPTTNQNPLLWVTFAANCDKFYVGRCWTSGLGNEEANANKNAVVQFADCDDYVIEDCTFGGDWAVGVISNVTAAALRGVIRRCNLRNVNATADLIIAMQGTSTGDISFVHGRAGNGAIAGVTCIDPGDMNMHEVKVTNADTVYSTYPGTVAS